MRAASPRARCRRRRRTARRRRSARPAVPGRGAGAASPASPRTAGRAGRSRGRPGTRPATPAASGHFAASGQVRCAWKTAASSPRSVRASAGTRRAPATPSGIGGTTTSGTPSARAPATSGSIPGVPWCASTRVPALAVEVLDQRQDLPLGTAEAGGVGEVDDAARAHDGSCPLAARPPQLRPGAEPVVVFEDEPQQQVHPAGAAPVQRVGHADDGLPGARDHARQTEQPAARRLPPPRLRPRLGELLPGGGLRVGDREHHGVAALLDHVARELAEGLLVRLAGDGLGAEAERHAGLRRA